MKNRTLRKIILIGLLLLLAEGVYPQNKRNLAERLLEYTSVRVLGRYEIRELKQKMRGQIDDVERKQLFPMYLITVYKKGGYFQYDNQVEKLKKEYSPEEVRKDFFSILFDRSLKSYHNIFLMDSEGKYTHRHISKRKHPIYSRTYFAHLSNHYILDNVLAQIFELNPCYIFQIKSLGVMHIFFTVQGEFFVGYNELDGWKMTDKVKIQPAHKFLQTLSDDEIYGLLAVDSVCRDYS